MIIIDAQIHIWSADVPARPWPVGRASYAHGPSLSAEEVLRVMDREGVARAMLVPPSWIGDDNSDSLAAARAHPDRFAVMGRFDLRAADAPARLERWLEQPGMRGIRLTFQRPPWQAWLADGSLDWFWAAPLPSGSAGHCRGGRRPHARGLGPPRERRARSVCGLSSIGHV